MKRANSSTKNIYLSLITACILTFFSSLGWSNEQPIQIAADKMTAVEKSQSVIFSGNVDAQQGDVRIRSDEMTIYYVKAESAKKKQKKDAQQVKKIFCKGNVEITSVEWLGTSDTMHYFSKKNLVQLIGNAKAYKGQNMVQGERINYYLDTGQSEVFGEEKTNVENTTADKKKGGRVNMTILEQ